MTFRTSSAHYEGAWWLKVATKEEGRFAGADVSVDAPGRKLRILSVEPSTSLARIDLAACGLRGREPIELVVDHSQGPVAFSVPEGWSAVALQGVSSQQKFSAEKGVVRVGMLAAGRYELKASD